MNSPRKGSWWTDFARGDRRDEEFQQTASQPDPVQLLPDGPPIEGGFCVVCNTDVNVHIRDRVGYSLEVVKNAGVVSKDSILKDEGGWRLFFCVPCAHSWLFPYLERSVGYTSNKILGEILNYTDKAVVVTKPEGESQSDS